jgi:acyl-CoA synthetase (AMP-forming)/AMP-acid ligase II
MNPSNASWGTRIEESKGPIPFKVFYPRPRAVSDVLQDAARFADRTYVVFGEQRLTYSEISVRAQNAAGALKSRDVGPGVRVMLLAANSADWIVAFWAATQLRATLFLGNGWWSAEETQAVLSSVDPHLIIADERGRRSLSVEAGVLHLDELIRAGRAAELTAKDVLRVVPPDEEDIAAVIMTSGTTGMPKGAMLSHRALIALLHMLLERTRRLPATGVMPEPEATLLTGPLFHMGGVQALLMATALGQTVVLLEGRFSASAVLDLIEREGVRRWGGVPTMITRVLNDQSIDGRSLYSLRSITLGGSPVPTEIVDRIHRTFPNVRRGVSQIYGMSEAGGTLTSASGRDSISRPGTAGRALPLVELRIENPNASGVGEICARTPTQMTGYWGEVDGSVIDVEGWLHTGDLGYLDDDGYLFVTGRLKDIIIRGGENIATSRVESVLLAHPDVVDAAVIALPDEDLGEIPAAVIHLRAGAEKSAAGLTEFAKTQLAYFEVPERWWFHDDELPVNIVGKVDKVQLRRTWPNQAAASV